MDGKNDQDQKIRSNPVLERQMDDKNNLSTKDESRFSLFKMFKRSKTDTQDAGFINKQIPAYWHEKS